VAIDSEGLWPTLVAHIPKCREGMPAEYESAWNMFADALRPHCIVADKDRWALEMLVSAHLDFQRGAVDRAGTKLFIELLREFGLSIDDYWTIVGAQGQGGAAPPRPAPPRRPRVQDPEDPDAEFGPGPDAE
jgi:hypothetical protein